MNKNNRLHFLRALLHRHASFAYDRSHRSIDITYWGSRVKLQHFRNKVRTLVL